MKTSTADPTNEQTNRRYPRSQHLPSSTKGRALTPPLTPTTPLKTSLASRTRAAVYEYTFTRRRVAEPLGTVRAPGDVTAVLRDFLRPDEAEQERLVVAVLNVKNAIIGVETVYIGNASGSSVRVGEVFRAAVRLNASAIVVAHNHPSGDPTPSAEDVSITTALAAAGHILDIPLLDHVIVGSYARCVSMRATGRIEA
jgi:DNA repair protein RadC